MASFAVGGRIAKGAKTPQRTLRRRKDCFRRNEQLCELCGSLANFAIQKAGRFRFVG